MGGKGGSAAKDAGRAEIQGLQMQIDQQNEAFDYAEQAYQPYQQTGLSALDRYKELIGMGGADQQNAAIQGLMQNPLYQQQLQQGENSVLQNASATGGLRTGNTQQALAGIAPQLLQALYGQQLGIFGGMQEQGLNVTSNLANIKGGNAAATGQAMAQQGAARGQSIIAQQAAGGGALSGAMSGAAAGATIGGPWGAVAGGVIGALGGK